ncbi:uncharacterized protein LOC129618437 isoform X3 [Condylostylus longicornis]|uniref:uncharacterized protein LOC129618437 isoform X3 n=1 Tax=Condylostylus longicornis TaxID=2530218 RepID=UPI00244E5AE5|nr:uncharacterized protein LOC129618437 isoform X3 [Condylostylus longicornis]
MMLLNYNDLCVIYCVQQAGSQLNTVADKLVQVERNLAENSENGELIDDVRVLELLESMAEVKNDYQNLRKDIKEVQQLQKEMTNSIRSYLSIYSSCLK